MVRMEYYSSFCHWLTLNLVGQARFLVYWSLYFLPAIEDVGLFFLHLLLLSTKLETNYVVALIYHVRTVFTSSMIKVFPCQIFLVQFYCCSSLVRWLSIFSVSVSCYHWGLDDAMQFTFSIYSKILEHLLVAISMVFWNLARHFDRCLEKSWIFSGTNRYHLD